MQQRTSQVLYAYWNEVRGERLAPRRFDIEPAQLGGVLSETFILECDDAKTATFRLAGTKVCDSFGREFRGTPFLELFAADDNDRLVQSMEDVRSHGSVLVMEAEARAPGHASVRFEIVLMPLVHTGTAISRLLGSITAIDPPIWLGTETLPPLDVLRVQMVWPDGRPHAIADKLRHQPVLIPELAGARLVRVNRRSFRVLDGGLANE